jgi:hypothetical protein
MLVSFELDMPNPPSWNGKWSGEGKLYCVIRNVGSSRDARAKWEKLIGRYSHRWEDGWTAIITVREVTSTAAIRMRKQSAGFCGYEWMIDAIAKHGKIVVDKAA